jgi:hypothetical protein
MSRTVHPPGDRAGSRGRIVAQVSDSGYEQEILERLVRLEEKVDATHKQTVETNGRVTKLERGAAYAAGAKAAMTWAPKLAFGLVLAVAGGAAGTLIQALIGG